MTAAMAFIDFKNKLKTIYGDQEAHNITEWVFENTTGLKKWEIRNSRHDLEEIVFDQTKIYLYELLQHKPVQYILHEAWFYKMKFYVDENVLIPRPETEELVEWVIDDIGYMMLDVRCKIIDIGAGCGCISISLKKNLPASNITAIDISEKVEKVIKINAQELNTEIDFLQVDFLNENTWNKLQQYDIIVSNPPYIPLEEKEILAKNVSDFEPQIALFVPDNDPFIFYNKISKFALSHLNENGKIYVEVHEKYANDVKNIFEASGFISMIKKDIYGKERMIRAFKTN
ncbi:MAG: peptide chain release factor N(5)-glutamine methyltransferase [Bacteroidota bacterium]|nr:peptide chain release factor N(5)-glutamine methyltransferase [Bacteroidota bacterium]